MSTSVAIAAAANAQAAAAAAVAAEARKTACKSLLKSYTPQGATVAEMRNYASCVETVYPEPIPAGGVIVLKVVIVLIMLATVAGTVYGAREDGVEGAFMYGLCGLLVSVLGFALLWLGAVGVMFVVA